MVKVAWGKGHTLSYEVAHDSRICLTCSWLKWSDLGRYLVKRNISDSSYVGALL